MRIALAFIIVLCFGAAPKPGYQADKTKGTAQVSDSSRKNALYLDSLLHDNKISRDLIKYRTLHDTTKIKP